MDKNTIIHLSNLSKINFTDEAIEEMIDKMTDIVDLMNTIKSFDISYDDTLDNNFVKFSDLREDIAEESFDTEALLQNAEHTDNCYIVPKLMD